MLASSHQISGTPEKESDCLSVWDRGEPDPKGTRAVGQAMKIVHMEHEPHTDVMHVDICEAPPGARIDAIEIGECVGFPGQILARVDLDRRIVYGITIHRFSPFKRRLMWQYRMGSIRRAMLLLIQTLCAGLRMEQHSNHAHLHV